MREEEIIYDLLTELHPVRWHHFATYHVVAYIGRNTKDLNSNLFLSKDITIVKALFISWLNF